jgi:hypothetical protein
MSIFEEMYPYRQLTHGETLTRRLAHLYVFCVQSHDILYKMSPDILYTPARAQRAPEHTDRCHGRRWMSENSE